MQQFGALVTHTRLTNKDDVQTASTPKIYTKTHTTFVTVTFPDNTFPTTSLSPQYAVVSSDSTHFLWPGHGIVLNSLHSPLSPGPPFSAETMTMPIDRSSTAISRRSDYLCPSPPGFLYPQPIVPRAAYEQQQNLIQHPQSAGTIDNSSVIWYLPYGLKTLLFTIIVLGFAWAIAAWLITFFPQTWSCSSHNCKWWSRFVPWDTVVEKQKQERRPLDKPSKYIKNDAGGDREGNENVLMPMIHLHKNTHHKTSPSRGEQGVEVKRRPRYQQHVSLCEASQYESTPCTPTTAKSPIHVDNMPLSSPLNLAFLQVQNTHLFPTYATLNTSTSSEWLAHHAHHAHFFTTPTPSMHSRTHSLADSADYAAMNTADIEALEAGNAASLEPRGWGLKKHERKTSWVDFGKEKVEDVVSGWVDRVARWTENDDDGVLLPVVNRRRGVKVE